MTYFSIFIDQIKPRSRVALFHTLLSLIGIKSVINLFDLIGLKFGRFSGSITFHLLFCMECQDLQWHLTCIDVQMRHKNAYTHCPESTETSLECSMAHNIRMYPQQNEVYFPNHRHPLNISGRYAFHQFHPTTCILFFLNQFF